MPPALFGIVVVVVDVVVVVARGVTVPAVDFSGVVVVVTGAMVMTGATVWFGDAWAIVVVTFTTISRTGAAVVVVVGAAREVPETVDDDVRYPLRAALTVMVEDADGDMPVTVTRPEDWDAEPDVAVNEYVYVAE